MSKNVWIGIGVAILIIGVYFVGRSSGSPTSAINSPTSVPQYSDNTSVQSVQAQTSAAPNNLNLQAQCAAQAQKTLQAFEAEYTNDGFDSTGATASTRTDFLQTNHYNPTMNKCFILISYDYTGASFGNTNFIGVITGESLLDAYENTELAYCVHSVDASKGLDRTDTCGRPGNGLMSYQAYADFVEQRMGPDVVMPKLPI